MPHVYSGAWLCVSMNAAIPPMTRVAPANACRMSESYRTGCPTGARFARSNIGEMRPTRLRHLGWRVGVLAIGRSLCGVGCGRLPSGCALGRVPASSPRLARSVGIGLPGTMIFTARLTIAT